MFTTLHSFNGADGANPFGRLALSGSTLYGTTAFGGDSGGGTVFAIGTNGMGFSSLHNFTGGKDGSNPSGGLTVSENTLFGTAYRGGSSGNGTIFAINTDGSGFATLHSFNVVFPGYSSIVEGIFYTNVDGANPYAGLIFSSNVLYGSASCGGSGAGGTVFTLNTNGLGFQTLYSFSPQISLPPDWLNNLDGGYPCCDLLMSSNELYGVTVSGGFWREGVLFAVNADGSNFINLHTFPYTYQLGGTNADGAQPVGGVILSDNVIYGAAAVGGAGGCGAIFSFRTDTMEFTNLYSFAPPMVGSVSGGLGAGSFISPWSSGPVAWPTNADGASPQGQLILSGGQLFGTTLQGGSLGYGTAFVINQDGSGFTLLHSFTGGSDGANPGGGLILCGNTLYGTTSYGGSSGHGTVFSISLQSVALPQLAITSQGINVVLSWPSSATGFSLQSAPASPMTWTAVSQEPVVTNGKNTVTVSISNTAQFFRLGR